MIIHELKKFCQFSTQIVINASAVDSLISPAWHTKTVLQLQNHRISVI